MSVKIVAEVGINHNGDLATALKLMLMAKECGADYVKFQKRTIEEVYPAEFLASARESPWGKTQRDQKMGLELTFTDYDLIDAYSREIGIPWFASCWDEKSLDFMEAFKHPLNKVASPFLGNESFLRRVASLKKKTLISTGMSDWGEILKAMDIFREAYCPFVLLHCVSEYPCPDERINLRMLRKLKMVSTEVGYSNHSPGIEACVGAAYLGAEWIEVHITLDRAMYGSDQAASLERRGLELVCKYCRNADTIMGDGVKILTQAERINAGKLRYWKNGK